ncbi:MAG TPA: hypothetical protein ENK02_07210 [Planctomycetes bacterium]|nr:hypothetical protein [Planctomycetota bacterium]
MREGSRDSALFIQKREKLPFTLQVELVPNPILIGPTKKNSPIPTTDAAILDSWGAWVDRLET